MRIATYEGEKSMPELVARLFIIAGAEAGLRQQEAEAALREAHPSPPGPVLGADRHPHRRARPPQYSTVAGK